MKYQKLQVQMTRFHDNIRPRYMNPTFISSNVSTTMGSSLFRSYSTNNIHHKTSKSDNKRHQQGVESIGSNMEVSKKSGISHNQRRSQSNLLSYGVRSLGPLKKEINDRDIYQKQQKKYNIVTIQPKEYVDSINIFPKYRLQNTDENYYKKIVLENQLSGKNRNQKQSNFINKVVDKKLDLNPEQTYSPEVPIKPFRGKLLNNIDELSGII